MKSRFSPLLVSLLALAVPPELSAQSSSPQDLAHCSDAMRDCASYIRYLAGEGYDDSESSLLETLADEIRDCSAETSAASSCDDGPPFQTPEDSADVGEALRRYDAMAQNESLPLETRRDARTEWYELDGELLQTCLVEDALEAYRACEYQKFGRVLSPLLIGPELRP